MPKLSEPKAPLVYAKALPKDKPYTINDGKGLGMVVMPDGSKRWMVRYSFKGAQKRIGIKGGYPAISIRAARDEAAKIREIVAHGEDPLALRKEGKEQAAKEREAEREEAVRQANTFERVAREWHARSSEHWVESSSKAILQRLERDLFPFFGSRPISEFRPTDILEPLRRVEERGARETARRLLGMCSMIFRYAVANGWILSDPARDLRGALLKPKERHFAAITVPREVAGLLRAVDAYTGTPETRAALKIGILTFVRPGNLRQAEWAEFHDLDKPDIAEWRIPGNKLKVRAQRYFTVPLAPQAVKILNDLRPLTGHSRYVFPSARSKDRPMSSMAVLAALRRMGYSSDEMTGHGTRAMARTICHEVLKFPPEVIEEQLAHNKPGTLGDAYDRTTHIAERRRLMCEWASYLDRLRSGEAG